MLSHEEALAAILGQAKILDAENIPIGRALGLVLAQNVKASMPFPHFDNSAVDGFAVRYSREILRHKSPQDDTVGEQNTYVCTGEIPAGYSGKKILKPGQAVAIFTGAKVPEGTDAVAMQEFAKKIKNSVTFEKIPEKGENIRRCGEDFKKGDLLISKGTRLEPQHLALLAGVGMKKVGVVCAASAAVLSTGNEIAPAGARLKPGQIYDCNTPLVVSLLQKTGAQAVALSKKKDNLASIRSAVRLGLKQDVLIVCGGVSVGKYDYVKKAFELEGVKEIFWKINIKPGKPVFFGKKGKTLVFGLPGNPVSAYVTFEEYVQPALLKMMGRSSQTVSIDGILTKGFQNGPRPQFVRAHCEKKKGRYFITLLRGQGSHQIGSLAKANAILKTGADEKFTENQTVRVKIMTRELFHV